MIPSPAEIRGSITAAARLMRGDETAIAAFDLSFDGFVKSFFAAVLAYPLYLLMLPVREEPTASWPAILGAETVGYVAGWLVSPIVAALVTRFLGLTARYVHLVVAVNWLALLFMAGFAALNLLSPLLPIPLAATVTLVVTVAILAIHWFVIRVALLCTAGQAASLLVIDLLVSTLLDRALEQAFGTLL